MGSVAPSVGTSDETIVRRGDGKMGKQKEKILTSDHVGRQTSDLGLLTLSISDNQERSKIIEEETKTEFCCCFRKRKPMVWL